MKKKINSRFFILVASAIIVTLLLTTFIYYNAYQKEVIDDLRSYAYIFEATDAFSDTDKSGLALKRSKIRVTLVSTDGIVIYDSEADTKGMKNHMNRPEVKAAMENGEGKAIRKSATMEKNTFYYAIKKENGAILRVSKEASSIWSIFRSASPAIMLVLTLLFLICVWVAHFLTESILMPIKEIARDIDNMENVSTYKEIMPFIKVIHSQHEDILKSAKIRQEFTANVSHELKTPLTSISGYSELIENGMATETDVARFAKEIHSSSQRLLALINDILKLSELDSQDLELEDEPINLLEIAKNCKGMLSLHADDNNVKVYVKGTPSNIAGSKRMLEEVIFNLCDNAIRYNKSGGNVWVNISETENEVIISVKDDGIGIPKKDQHRIFERFYRVDKSRSKKTGGTGLGLAIVKHIIEQHNAEIFVESEEGKGTEIRVVFKK